MMARRAWVLILAALAMPMVGAAEPPARVLFLCEHGNVKSLMAAEYFNREAAERGLQVRAEARGIAPDTSGVPPAIAAGLASEGYDVSAFHARPLSAADVAGAVRVIRIGTVLPPEITAAAVAVEGWDDVPPASQDFPAARSALRAHIAELLRTLAPASPH